MEKEKTPEGLLSSIGAPRISERQEVYPRTNVIHLMTEYAAPYKQRCEELEKDRDEYRERYTCNQHTVVNLQSQLSEQRAIVEELKESIEQTINAYEWWLDNEPEFLNQSDTDHLNNMKELLAKHCKK